jgi:leucyl aminopeptidase
MLPTVTNVIIQIKSRLNTGLEAVAVFVTEGSTDAGEAAALLNEDERAAVARMLAAGVARGKLREVQANLLDTPATDKPKEPEYRRLLVVGLGKAEKLSPEAIRQAAGALAKAARRMRLTNIGVVLPVLHHGEPGSEADLPAHSTSPATVAEAVATGVALAAFEYTEYKGTASKRKQDDEEPGTVRRTFTLVSGEDSLPDARRGVERGRTIADAQNFARTIASRPGNDINPPSLAKVAEELAKEVGLGCRILDEKELAKLKMGGILAVGSGASSTPPRMIVLEWTGKPSKSKGAASAGAKSRKAQPLLVVGKAITFDTGGISVKPADKMGKMIFDKSGGMAVLGLMYAVAKLGLPVHVVGILSSAENAISASAYRPGDILRMYNGVTVDVTNTDAEGRLVLGDALAWGIETYNPSAVVDLATLTGAIVVALGHFHAGLFSNSDGLAADLSAAAELAGEKLWRMPLTEEYRERIKADAADIVNAAGRDGGCCTAAAFLSYFVPGDFLKDFVPWAHLDIAGVADTEKELPYYAKGSVAWGVRTLVEWVAGKVEPRVPHAAPRAAGG